jgi:hypothetical protein
MCGFSWGGGGAYKRYGCAAGGAHSPFPFVLGGLQLLATNVVRLLGQSHRVAGSAAHIDQSLLHANKYLAADDVVLGWWLADLQV